MSIDEHLNDLFRSDRENKQPIKWYDLDTIEEMICHDDAIINQTGSRFRYIKNPVEPRLCWQAIDYPSGGLDREFLLKNPVNRWRIL